MKNKDKDNLISKTQAIYLPKLNGNDRLSSSLENISKGNRNKIEEIFHIKAKRPRNDQVSLLTNNHRDYGMKLLPTNQFTIKSNKRFLDNLSRSNDKIKQSVSSIPLGNKFNEPYYSDDSIRLTNDLIDSLDPLVESNSYNNFIEGNHYQKLNKSNFKSVIDTPREKRNNFNSEKDIEYESTLITFDVERLIDNKFINSLFIKSLALSESQDLINRMESLFISLDNEQSGFISWDLFCKIILSIIPKHILRYDIIDFLDAQHDNPFDLVNYRDFVITGKVIIMRKQLTSEIVDNNSNKLKLSGWLNRQRMISGDSSTYTWKKHVEWFNSRRSKAVIWLMKLASNNLKSIHKATDTTDDLKKIGRCAIVLTDLLNIGHKALQIEKTRLKSKEFFVERINNTKKWKIRQKDAFKSLKSITYRILQLEKKYGISYMNKRNVYTVDLPVQANITKVYQTYHMRKLVSQQLLDIGHKAIKHTMKQLNISNDLKLFSNKLKNHEIKLNETFDYLSNYANKKKLFLITKDNSYFILLRKGLWAISFLDKKLAAYPWLIDKANQSKNHNIKQYYTLIDLITYSQKCLSVQNKREVVFKELKSISLKSIKHLYRQQSIYAHLCKFKDIYYNSVNNKIMSYNWLKSRGSHSLQHVNRKHVTLLDLMSIGAQSSITFTKYRLAYTELRQTAQYSKYQSFANIWLNKKNKNSYKRVLDEIKVIQINDNRITTQRKDIIDVNELLRVELIDIFIITIRLFINPLIDSKSVDLSTSFIGKLGFNYIVQNIFTYCNIGKDIPIELLSQYFSTLDPLSYGYITFDQLLNWLINHMTLLNHQVSNKLTKQSKKMKFKFTMNQVIPISTRALLNLMKRFDYYKSKEYIDDDDNDFDLYNINDKSAKQLVSEDIEDINSDIDDYQSIQSSDKSIVQINKLEEVFNDDDDIDYEKQRGEDGFIGIGDEYGDDEIGRLLRKVIPR